MPDIALCCHLKRGRERVQYSRYDEKERNETRPGSTYVCQYIDREKKRYEKKTTNTVKESISRNKDSKRN